MNKPTTIHPKSEELIRLKALRDRVAEDYKNPEREGIIVAYHAELTRCCRYYFDDRLEEQAIKNGGAMFGEETMLANLDEETAKGPSTITSTLIQTATTVRREVMAQYGITPKQTGWSHDEMHTITLRVAGACVTATAARAYWIDLFLDLDLINEAILSTVDAAILQQEESNIRA